jgi:hypothetical protein
LVFRDNKDERMKKCLSLINWNFSIIGLLKSAILISAALFEIYQKSLFHHDFFEPQINEEEFFEKIAFWKRSFHSLLKYPRHLGFFPKKLTDSCSEHKNL